MNTSSLTLNVFILMLIADKSRVYGDKADNCTIDITVQRHTKYNIISGDSATIECPVKYCQKQPKVNWYIYNTTHKNFSILLLRQNRTASWINKSVFVLNIPSVNTNDNGQYRCEAKVDENTITGHAIEVIIQDYSNFTITEPGDARNTTEGHGVSEKNKMLIIYILSSLGALGLLTFCCYGLLQSSRRHQVKNKTISSVLQMEMNGFPDGGSVNSNQHICKKTNTTTSQPTCDKSVTNQLLPENQNTLVYATLDHGEHFQRSEPFVETEFTEYAAIVLKN